MNKITQWYVELLAKPSDYQALKKTFHDIKLDTPCIIPQICQIFSLKNFVLVYPFIRLTILSFISLWSQISIIPWTVEVHM
jgi:hypothetical protein